MKICNQACLAHIVFIVVDLMSTQIQTGTY